MHVSLLTRGLIPAVALVIAPVAVAQTTYGGSDDGSSVGGPNANSDAAEAAFLVDATSYGTVTTLDFESAATGDSGSFSFPGVTVSSTSGFGNGFSGVSDTTLGNLYGYSIGGGSKWFGFPTGTATFNFAGTTNSFGFYTTGLQTSFGTTLTVSMNGANATTFNLPVNVNGGASYFGFTTASAFNTVTIDRPGFDAWGIDRVSYNLGAVPEPSTWALMILGFGAIGAAMRRRSAVKVKFA